MEGMQKMSAIGLAIEKNLNVLHLLAMSWNQVPGNTIENCEISGSHGGRYEV
jgi:hypothetical protein